MLCLLTIHPHVLFFPSLQGHMYLYVTITITMDSFSLIFDCITFQVQTLPSNSKASCRPDKSPYRSVAIWAGRRREGPNDREERAQVGLGRAGRINATKRSRGKREGDRTGWDKQQAMTLNLIPPPPTITTNLSPLPNF